MFTCTNWWCGSNSKAEKTTEPEGGVQGMDPSMEEGSKHVVCMKEERREMGRDKAGT